MVDINARIAAMQAELADLIKERDAAALDVDTIHLADNMHSLFCRLDHVEQCGWKYETRSNQTTHMSWYKKAEKARKDARDGGLSVNDLEYAIGALMRNR